VRRWREIGKGQEGSGERSGKGRGTATALFMCIIQRTMPPWVMRNFSCVNCTSFSPPGLRHSSNAYQDSDIRDRGEKEVEMEVEVVEGEGRGR